jgi:hypothetical protein
MFDKVELWRTEDETGISGTGRVAEGVRFSDGKIVLRWMTDTRSTCFYDSFSDVMTIHGHGGKTKLKVCGTPWERGRRDAIQDNLENAPFGSVRGTRSENPVKRKDWVKPDWIAMSELTAYFAGYEAQCNSI